MNEIARIQDWFRLQCNGEWEHTYGVKIETLDNPGWVVQIDLTGTEYEAREFEFVSYGNSQEDESWLDCTKESKKFIGYGGVGNLMEILNVFLRWVEK